MSKVWKTESIATRDLLLDVLNPRIDANKKTTQAQLRELLLNEANVLSLAKGIVKTGGLMAGERIIVTYENEKPVVLEGNRRTTACQLLLNPRLVPEHLKKKFPKEIDAALKKAIENLSADVAPSRDAADGVITRRHTQPGVSKWSVVAKQRRIIRLLEEGKTPAQIMESLQISRAMVLNTLRDHNLLRRVKALKGWTKRERAILDDPKTKVNPILRFFTLEGAKEKAGISFNRESGEVESSMSNQDLDKVLFGVAKGFLIPDKDSGKAKFNTRTPVDSVYGQLVKDDEEVKRIFQDKNHSSQSQPQNKPKAPVVTAKATMFFESLVCSVSDDRLVRLCAEISTIKYEKYPIAATFLLRALIESSLIYALKRHKKFKDMKQEFYQGKQNQGREPGLDFVIRYCKKNSAQLYVPNGDRILGLVLASGNKDWMDMIVHGVGVSPNDSILEKAASVVRQFIQDILLDNYPTP